MTISRIVSGGQTGADRGALEAAMYCDIPHGGWCPLNRKAEDGTIPEKYTLSQMPTGDYLARTEANVIDSDATLVFTPNRPTGGSLRTIEFCMKHRKPWLHVSLAIMSGERAEMEIIRWIEGDPELNSYEDYEAKPPDPCILNVAGSRGSKAPGIAGQVEAIMVDVLRMANRLTVYPMVKSNPMILR